MKEKKYEDYTREEFENLSYNKREELRTNYEIRKITKRALIIIVVIFLLITLFKSITTVPTGYVGVKTRFGKVQETTIQEGLNFKVPFIEKMVKIDCRTQKTEYTMEASSKDLQKVSNIKIAVNYSVDKQKANILYKEIGKDFNTVVVEPSIYESMKSAIANYTAEELVTKRQEVSNLAQETLTNKLKENGINVLALNLIDLSFSAEFDQAIENKQIVEQQTQQAQYELEKAKIENEKKIENAKAEAEVMRQQNEQITEQTLRLKELENQAKMIEKWSGNLPTTVTSDDIFSLLKIGE